MGLIDVVNFNADASCLASETWLSALEGGAGSRLCAWLRLYPEHGRKMSLGLLGSTIAEIHHFNPEALELIAAHPSSFELVLRPFSHDIALLRTRYGFLRNVELGRRAIEGAGLRATPFFLPPEFMLTAEQLTLLSTAGVEGVFVNRGRFRGDVGARIPSVPYDMVGVMGGVIRALPIEGPLTQAYLASIWSFSADPWNEAIAADAARTHHVSWRDGETAFLTPDGVDRERVWLRDQADVPREFVRDLIPSVAFMSASDVEPPFFRSYPPHSFAPWTREMRMFGFLQRIHAIEAKLPELSLVGQAMWLQAINSDVLSAVEKEPPVIMARVAPGAPPSELTLHRSERGFEGEELLVLLEAGCEAPEVARFVRESSAPHLARLRARVAYLRLIQGERAESP